MRTSLSFVAVLALVACSCEKKSSQTTEAAPDANGETARVAAADDVILVGEVGSLTGAEATFGISTHNGIQMAVEETNAQGGVKGKKLVVRVYDDQSKPEEAASAAARLITQDRAKIILGEVASSNSLAMAPKAQEAKVPMISPSSTNPAVTEVGDYIFRVCFIDPFQGFVMAKFARDNLKFTRVAVLKDVKSAYSIGLAEVFDRKFTEMGGRIVATEAYSKGDTDFRAQLTAIKSQKPEAIYVPGYYTDAGVIARQARELGLKVSLMGGDGWDSEKLFELGATAVEGSYISNHYSTEDPSPRVQSFVTSYKQKFGVLPDGLAALGYDTARVAIESMKRAPDLSGPALRDAIGQTRDFPGVTGTISIDDKRNAVKPAVILKIAEGKWKYETTIAP